TSTLGLGYGSKEATLPTTQSTTVAELQQLLEAGADDESVIRCFDRLLQSWNLEAAAAGFFGAAGRLCSCRPHLAERALRIPIEWLVQLSVDSVEIVFRFVKSNIDEQIDHFVEDAGPQGLRWLQVELPKQHGLIQQLLTEALRCFPAD